MKSFTLHYFTLLILSIGLFSCATRNKVAVGYGGKWEEKTGVTLNKHPSKISSDNSYYQAGMSVFNAEIKSEKIENTKLEKVSNNFKGQGKSNAFVISPVVSKTTCGNANLTTKINDSKEIKKSNENPPKGKSQLAALLLCIFLGDIGVHRFYLGYPLIGILQILTLGGLGVWTLIDLVFIITGDLKPKNGEYTETLQSLKKKKDNPTQI